MEQDVRHGRETAIDFLNGYFVKRAEELGIASMQRSSRSLHMDVPIARLPVHMPCQISLQEVINVSRRALWQSESLSSLSFFGPWQKCLAVLMSLVVHHVV